MLFCFTASPTSDIFTLSLHDALPICQFAVQVYSLGYMHDAPRFKRFYAYLSLFTFSMLGLVLANKERDRKSTRLNSSHVAISYAVFCLKKKNNIYHQNKIKINNQ